MKAFKHCLRKTQWNLGTALVRVIDLKCLATPQSPLPLNSPHDWVPFQGGGSNPVRLTSTNRGWMRRATASGAAASTSTES
eukprot:6476671-Pyramimonas_sp.AAC.1